jgi:hypothetical protein
MRATTEQKWKCVERELKMRVHVYPRLVDSGKMTYEKAALEIGLMREICDDYKAMTERERLL